MRIAACGLILAVSLSCPAQVVPPSYGFDFVTIGAPGNPAFNDPNYPFQTVANGRGSVPYEYRISRMEVTTGQWMEFLNSYSHTLTPHPFWDPYGPSFWGATLDPLMGPGAGYRLRNVPNAATLPVAGITWRMAALYTNWLHNGQGSTPEVLVTGAYNSATWGTGPGNSFTDEWRHLPGARYWIPTLDEQIKSQHYDPDRYGPGLGGWWMNKNGSDEPGTPGPPGVGTTSAGWEHPTLPWGEWDIPLGAYPASVSPWGLLDTSGGAQEWMEEVFWPWHPVERGHSGTYAGSAIGALSVFDTVHGNGSNGPSDHPRVSIRVASAIPSPGPVMLAGGAAFAACIRRKRRQIQ